MSYRIITIPTSLGYDHPWVSEFGHAGTVPCAECGAHLKRVCLVSGAPYGLDCASRVFGLDLASRAPRMRAEAKLKGRIVHAITGRRKINPKAWASDPSRAQAIADIRIADAVKTARTAGLNECDVSDLESLARSYNRNPS